MIISWGGGETIPRKEAVVHSILTLQGGDSGGPGLLHWWGLHTSPARAGGQLCPAPAAGSPAGGLAWPASWPWFLSSFSHVPS